MVTINVDFGPHQCKITRERILDMITWEPRRTKLSIGWRDPLHPPRNPGDDWSIVLPFCETFDNALLTMCKVDNIGLRKGKENRGFTFIKDGSEEALEKVRDWLRLVGNFVAIRDCLALSYAIDYDREEGDPDKTQTKIGTLRNSAKPYDKVPTADTYRAADELVKECLDFLEKMTCYSTATCTVGMPPSRPDKPFDLPKHLADKISKKLGITDLTHIVKTIKERPQLKDARCDKKLESIEGSISVDHQSLKDQTVLLIDDIYQSGVSTNYVAMLMLEAGAKKVYGLACEKTCRNDDNIPRSSIK
jgi:hypothetical protein